jgi:cobalt-zinc-cadmium efflux system protein
MPTSGKTPLVFLASVLLNAAQAAVKLAAFIIVGSLAIYAETLHSVSDVINSFILYLASFIVNKKPSPKYPFGFGRFPYIASIISVSILVGAIANNILTQAYEALHEGGRLYGDVISGAYLVTIAIAIDLAILLYVYRTREIWRNPSSKMRPLFLTLILEDLFSLSGNSVALASLYMIGINSSVDVIASIVIAAIILVASAQVIYRNIEILIGRSAPRDVMLKILNRISKISDVVDIDDLKSYVLTPDNIVIMATIGVDPRKSIGALEALRERIIREITSIDPRIKNVIIQFSSEPIDDRDRDKIYREVSSMDE